MMSRHLRGKLKRVLAMVLTVALLVSDHAVLYAAGADAAEVGNAEPRQESTADSDDTEPQQESTDSTGSAGQQAGGNTAAVSGGDSGGTAVAEGPGKADEDTPGTVSGGDAAEEATAPDKDPGTVSGGDAEAGEDTLFSEGLTAGARLPEQFYKEEKQEVYGTLVSYDEYSRTYHVEGSWYVTVVGNDGTAFIDDDGNLMPVDNTLEKESAAVFGISGGEQQSCYVNRANDYMVFLPENPDLEEGRGITIADRDGLITLYPAEGSFRNGLAKDNAIRYSNVFPGVDYQYTVLGNSVKEDIILLERGEKNSFSYLIDTCGSAWELKNNTLYLYEEGTDPEADASFVLEAPEMMDSAGEISFGVRLSVEEISAGEASGGGQSQHRHRR